MTDVLKAHESVWRQLGAQVEDESAIGPLARDCLFVLPGAAVRGLDNARPYFAAYLEAFPDTKKRVQHVARDETTVVVRSILAGRNTGTFHTGAGEAPPTGREVQWDIVEWLVVEDGVIVEWRVYQDATPYIDALRNLQRHALDQGGEACIADAVVVTRLDSPAAKQPEHLAADGGR